MRLTSVGMICSVGLRAAAACAAIRAGIARFGELRYLDNRMEPIIGAMVPGLPPLLGHRGRLIEMLALDLSDCLRECDVEPEMLVQVPLLVGLAEPQWPFGSAETARTVIAGVESRLGLRFHPSLSCTLQLGHTAGFRALQTARELFRDGRVPACLICGVDSYLNAEVLLWLDEHSRLKTEVNSDGLIPGEAAAAVLVTPPSSAKAGITAQVMGLGFGLEEAGVLSNEPLLGLGLTAAARVALAEAGMRMDELDFRISDVAGESYGFKEQALVMARLLRTRKEALPLWHCADSIGDTGAAAGVCQLVSAFQAFRRSYAPGNRAICFSSSVAGERAAVVVERYLS